MDRNIYIENFPQISIFDCNEHFNTSLECIKSENGVYIYKLTVESESEYAPKSIALRWKIPFLGIQGVWKPGADHDKRQQYDWELDHLESRISVDSPVISVFDYNDNSKITFASSDVVNLVSMNALLREEDNNLYCHMTFFSERHPKIKKYESELYINTNSDQISSVLKDVSEWWESKDYLKPASVPAIAKAPLYSTWYQFHQDLSEDKLIKECEIAYELGYRLIIVDDGWQTIDNNRGYDYTGDWTPDRFSNMSDFVKKLQDTGMKVGIWFSVPFCGKKSKAYKRFSGKFLTENHRWAPVFDPRFPEVRSYLVDIYTKALKVWGVDALKLDFIDDFRVYPDTDLAYNTDRDFTNVNAAVDKLLSEISASLKSINPDVAIEFRQKYVGPALRKYGNMFRAFDCPNDPVTNRIRIADIKMLIGSSAVHSDMLTWHSEDDLTNCAIQIINSFFAVPQMSINLQDANEDIKKMLQFYNRLWVKYSDIILDGDFKVKDILSNYTLLSSQKNEAVVIGIYNDVIVELPSLKKAVLLNGKNTDSVVVKSKENGGIIEVYNCLGVLIQTYDVLSVGLNEYNCPPGGLLIINTGL